MKKFMDVFIMVVAALLCTTFTMMVSEGQSGNTTAYNFLFLGIIVIMYTITIIVGFFRMHRLSGYFKWASGVIDYERKEGKLSVPEKVNKIKGFAPIDKRLNSFLQDLKSSKSGICDIMKYINSDETDTLISKWFLDVIPDFMTSMGILGTFVGLVWGLRSFDPSGFETMTASVSSLVDGIKVAFLTSIYGILMSLCFSYCMNRHYADLNNDLALFIDMFHAGIIPPADIDAQNRLVSSQKGQYEILKSMCLELSDSMSSGFTQSIGPVLKRIDQSLDGVLQEIAANQQTFITEMSDSYRQFGASSDSNERVLNAIIEVCQNNENIFESQKMLISQMSEVLDKLVEKIGGGNEDSYAGADIDDIEDWQGGWDEEDSYTGENEDSVEEEKDHTDSEGENE